ncbi:MAG: diguanylate cyclase, partial [Cyanobacteria bacterium P01_A01_bin.137]
KTLQQGVRRSDFVARYGGEEFVIVLPNTEISVTHEILKGIQAKLASLEIAHRASDVSDYVTLSFGIIALDSLRGVTPKVLIEQADKALYRAKHQGRNRISCL